MKNTTISKSLTCIYKKGFLSRSVFSLLNFSLVTPVHLHQMQPYTRGVARVFQRGDHTVSHSGYLHCPLQMFSPENGVCNYLASTRKYLWHVDSSDSGLFFHLNYKVCALFI